MARFAVVKMENKSGGLWAPAKEPRALGVCERSKTETVLRWIQPKMAIVAKSTIVEFLLEGVSQSTQFPLGGRNSQKQNGTTSSFRTIRNSCHHTRSVTRTLLLKSM